MGSNPNLTDLAIPSQRTQGLGALALVSLLTVAARAEDWPQWRGPNRDGVWNETGIVESFPPGGLKFSWRVAVGPGWSSPVVAQGRVYVTDVKLTRPSARERVLCVDEETGKLLWTRPRARPGGGNHSAPPETRRCPPRSSPGTGC